MVRAPAERGHSAKQPTNWLLAPQLSLAAWTGPALDRGPVRTTTPGSRLATGTGTEPRQRYVPWCSGRRTRRATATTYHKCKQGRATQGDARIPLLSTELGKGVFSAL